MNIPIEVTAEQLADVLLSIHENICVVQAQRAYEYAMFHDDRADRLAADEQRLNATFEYLECFLPGVRADV